MAVELFDPTQAYRGLSSDTKPSNPSHDLFYETDTGTWYVHNGTAWVEYVSPASSSTFEAINLSAQGLIAQNFDRQLIQASTTLTSGTVHAMLVPVRAGMVITNTHIRIAGTAGSGVTMAKMALLDLNGNRLAATANQTTDWETQGMKTIALTSPYTVTETGAIYVAALAIASTTQPSAYCNAAVINTDVIGSGARPFASEAGQTDIDATVALGGTGFRPFWVGLS